MSINSQIGSIIVKYADDTTTISPLFKDSTNSHISDEHDIIVQWSASNGLKLNASKSKSLIFGSKAAKGIKLTDIPIVDDLKLLGITFSSDLSWQKHINNIVLASTRRLYALRVLKPLVSKDVLSHVYIALIRSLLEYCSPLFVSLNAGLSATLNRIQHCTHFIICRKYCDWNCLPSLDERRFLASKKLIISATTNDSNLLNNLIPRVSYSKRNGLRFLIDFASTTRRLNSCISYTCTKLF